MSLEPEQFQHAIPNLDFMLQDIKEKRFRKITSRAVPLFMRGRDTISITPSVAGRHEVDVEEVLRWAAQSGHGDFLLDIGANIGLVACLVGDRFSRVYCYEPNPLAFHILSVNTRIALPADGKVCLFNYGIGNESAELKLLIPKHNWGGAYVAEGNAYDEATLLKKDGYSRFEADNYLCETVAIRAASEALGPVFEELALAGLKRGVIKIDTEGYELRILKAIGRILPAGFQLVVVFENHLKHQLKDEILSLFAAESRLFEIRTHKVRGAMLVRLIKSLCGAQRRVALTPVGEHLGKGNYALLVGA